MTLSRWDRLEDLLERAGEVPPTERAAFVDRETSGDPQLHAELTALLAEAEGADEYFSRLRDELLGSTVPGIIRELETAVQVPDPWIGRTVAHYEILERIGGGGMGVIYRAHDARLDRTVALKFIAPEIRADPESQRRFLQEARAASALDHPNICTIHQIAETEDRRLFIVMAAYEGETLRARIDRQRVPDAETLTIAEQMAQALAVAHERGIVHRDVKPDNVFITREGVVKLLDFGLARVAASRMSGPGSVEGTVAYMSPEQARGERADQRSDVWALGVVLFEMFAGARPFTADSPGAAIELILTREPDLAAKRPDLAPAILELVHRALAKDPARRFATGREILEALSRARTAVKRTASRQRPDRRALLIGAAIGSVLVLVSVVALLIRADSETASAGAVATAAGSVSHVLWVDDNPENNAEVVRQLEGRGVRVTRATSTADAVERYDPAVYQLVVSDMGRYEGVNNDYVERAGFNLLERLQVRRPDVQLVFCTSARAAATHRAEALSAGVLAVVEDCAEVLAVMGF
jgi:serine/threonine-protein kinase